MKHSKYWGAGILISGLLGFSGTAFAQTSDVPDNITNITIDQAVMETIDRQLPEAQAVGAEFLDEAYSPNLRINQQAQVGISFITEGAGYRNSVGYFTYTDNAFDGLTFGAIDTDGSGNISAREIESLAGVGTVDIIFGNASGGGGWAGSGGSLQTGDTAVLGGGTVSQTADGITMSGGTVFEAGTNVGFFLAANAWNGSGVNGWDNGQDPATYWTLDFLNPENDATAEFSDVSRSTRHVAMLGIAETEQVIMGFEDLNRNSGDNDFNDAVFIVHSDPLGSLAGSTIPTVSAAPSPGVTLGLMMVMLAGAGLSFRRLRQ